MPRSTEQLNIEIGSIMRDVHANDMVKRMRAKDQCNDLAIYIAGFACGFVVCLFIFIFIIK